MACYILQIPPILSDSPVNLSCKIGKANDVVQREKNLQTAWPFDPINRWYLYPKLESKYSSGMLFHIEQQAHKFFADQRVRPDREFFTIGNNFDIDNQLKKFVDEMENLGISIGITQNPADLKDISDPSLIDGYLESHNSAVEINQSASCLTSQSASCLTNQSALGLTNQQIYQPRPYQREILNKLAEWHEGDDKAGKLILPPGIGKSYITAFHLRDYVQELHSGTSILILVPSKCIAHDFQKALISCGLKHVAVIHSEGEEFRKTDFSKPKIYIVLNDTAKNNLDVLEEQEFELIIYDEAHHYCARGNRQLLQLQSFKKLFLTATELIYENGKQLDMNDYCFGKLIFRMTIGEAVEKRLLADYKIYLPDHTSPVDIACKLFNSFHRRKIVVFANSVKESMDLAASFVNYSHLMPNGLKIFHLDGQTPMTERQKVINAFEKAPYAILCNVAIVGEGVNIPCIDSIVFADARHSPIGVIQNIGRGLRLHPSKDFCMVVIHKEMIKNEFIIGLAMYDQRFHQHADKMVLSSRTLKALAKPDYSVQSIVKLIEIYDSKNDNRLEKFIRALQREQIYSEVEYRARYANRYDEEHPEDPLMLIPTFSWHMLALQDDSVYDTLDEVKEAIDALLDDESIAQSIKCLKTNNSRLHYLRNMDNKIPVDLEKKFNMKFSDIHNIFIKERSARNRFIQ